MFLLPIEENYLNITSVYPFIPLIKFCDIYLALFMHVA